MEEKVLLETLNFVLDSIKGKDSILKKYEGEDYEVFAGTIAGSLQGFGEIILQSDPLLYQTLIDAVEKMALR